MIDAFNQTNLFGLNAYLDELKSLYENNKLPKKIIFSGPKGLGKFTLSLHLINYILSKDEEFPDNVFEGETLVAIREMDMEGKTVAKSAKRLLRLAFASLLGEKPLNSRNLFASN